MWWALPLHNYISANHKPIVRKSGSGCNPAFAERKFVKSVTPVAGPNQLFLERACWLSLGWLIGRLQKSIDGVGCRFSSLIITPSGCVESGVCPAHPRTSKTADSRPTYFGIVHR